MTFCLKKMIKDYATSIDWSGGEVGSEDISGSVLSLGRSEDISGSVLSLGRSEDISGSVLSLGRSGESLRTNIIFIHFPTLSSSRDGIESISFLLIFSLMVNIKQ